MNHLLAGTAVAAALAMAGSAWAQAPMNPSSTTTTNPYATGAPSTSATTPYAQPAPSTSATAPYAQRAPATSTTAPYAPQAPATAATNAGAMPQMGTEQATE